MNWPLLLSIIGCAASVVGTLAAATAVYVTLSIRAELAEARLDLIEKIRRDINGSYMRAAEVREIVERIEAEIRALAARITLIEGR